MTLEPLARTPWVEEADDAPKFTLDSISTESGGSVSYVGLDPEEAWGELAELPPLTSPAPPLPPDMLPTPFRNWVQDAAKRASLPLEMVAVPALVSAAAVVGCKIGIHPKKYDDWLVIPNLWGAVIGRPGVMKSAAVTEGKRFLARLEAEAKEQYDRDALAAQVHREVLEADIARIKKELKGGQS